MRQHHNVTLAILALACTAFALQQTMVIPALPVLQRDLGTTTWVTWVLVALSEGHAWGWTSARILGLFAAALTTAVIWGIVETRVADPLVDMRMLAHRPILFTNATAAIAGFAMFGTFVLIPNFVEMPHGLPAASARLVDYGFDANATKAGLYLLPGSVMLLFSGPVAGRLGSRIGFKWPLAIGLALVAASASGLAAFHDRPWQIWASQGVLGIGIGFAFASMATLIAENVRPEETGVASGMNTVMRSIGGVIGGQTGAALLAAYTIGDSGLPAERAYVITFAISAGAAVVGAVLACFTPEPRHDFGR